MLARRVIAILSAVSLSGIVAGLLVIMAPVTLCSLRLPGFPCAEALTVAVFFVSLLLLVACVTGLVAWIMGMLQAADEKRWGWFVAVLLLGAIGSLAYGLAKPNAISADK
jgi:Na+-driven multidrug efflux pump